MTKQIHNPCFKTVMLRVVSLAAIAFLLGGCATGKSFSGGYSRTPSANLINTDALQNKIPESHSKDDYASSKHLSKNFGFSYTAMFSMQVINPDAPEDKIPVDGYPGNIAEKVYENYKTLEDRLIEGEE